MLGYVGLCIVLLDYAELCLVIWVMLGLVSLLGCVWFCRVCHVYYIELHLLTLYCIGLSWHILF